MPAGLLGSRSSGEGEKEIEVGGGDEEKKGDKGAATGGEEAAKKSGEAAPAPSPPLGLV